MSGFDRFLIVDWSAASAPTPKRPSANAIWLADCDASGACETSYHRTRADAMEAIGAAFEDALAQGQRVLAGFDFPFGYPAGFAEAVTGQADAFAVWEMLADRLSDAPDNANNRFELAAALNAALPGTGPFWGRPAQVDLAGLPEKGSARAGHGFPERRAVEGIVSSAQPCWKLYTTGSVGSQMLTGLPRLAALRKRFGAQLKVWPFEAPDAPIVLAEIYPSLLDEAVRAASGPDDIKDDVQVRQLAQALAAAQRDGALDGLLAAPPDGAARREEGWILGVGRDAVELSSPGVDLAPPPLSNDCFALPRGVDWTPVDAALDYLHGALKCVVGVETCATDAALGRVLAKDHVARRANPPAANSAVDGYGFAGNAVGDGPQILPLLPGRAAAGAPYAGHVTEGSALRVLTGALIPEGVDTVVLEEDTRRDAGRVAFRGPVKRGANTRKAGEDVAEGALALPAGRALRPADLALLSALGVPELSVRAQLRVGVLSTGDELVPSGVAADPGKTYDANRPMLLSIADRWGYRPVDLGHVADDRALLADALDRAAEQADIVLTSGGASAGDEDHISALLTERGAMETWRVALKPGRPLAMGVWQGMPILGLPGNPVAAFVCTLIFARPACALLSGADWPVPQGFTVPAAFEKRKKPGRREYLRARIDAAGHAEVFASEGSGRISGLAWADGLVEIDDGPCHIQPGDPVRYLPYSSFGL